MITTYNIKNNKKCININFYDNLLKKLATKGLLTKSGGQKNAQEYCVEKSYYEYKKENLTFYSGIIIKELSELNDFEIAMLMASEDIISYDIKRNERFFELFVYN